MLSYQLYLESQNNSQDPGKGIPIKKLFVDKDNITIDNTTLAQFGDIESPLQMTQFLKTKFDMPLDTTLNLNLPNKIVASNSSKPYVTISGSIKTTKKKDDVIGEITLTLKTKDEKSFAKINIPDYDDPEITSSDTPLKIDSKNYKIGSQMLYDAYCQNQILQNDRLGAGLFERIAKKFLSSSSYVMLILSQAIVVSYCMFCLVMIQLNISKNNLPKV